MTGLQRASHGLLLSWCFDCVLAWSVGIYARRKLVGRAAIFCLAVSKHATPLAGSNTNDMAVAGAAKRARILVSGASGMVGTALIDSLRKPSTGLTPQISRLVRHDPQGPDEVFWDPYEMRIDVDAAEGFDAVVHLAGKPLAPADVACSRKTRGCCS